MGAGMVPTGKSPASRSLRRGPAIARFRQSRFLAGSQPNATAMATIITNDVVNTSTSPTPAPIIPLHPRFQLPAAARDLGCDGFPSWVGGTAARLHAELRAVIHLHGACTPWMRDGTPDQWTNPGHRECAYPPGCQRHNVPDMPDPGPGSATLFYTNEQSARLMFYHDHSYGITRLDVYAGEAAGYLLRDSGRTGSGRGRVRCRAANEIPLVIQDKTFVPSAAQLATEESAWNSGSQPGTVVTGDLWFPHVYMPNQNPFDMQGVNSMGRWDYGPWFWPPSPAS